MNQWHQFSIFWQQEVSVLMIEYLVCYVTWIMDDAKLAIFVALMTVAVEIDIEKSGVCVW